MRSLIGGFYRWNGFTPPVYVGVSQFRQYLQSPDFGMEVKNIAVLTGGSILVSLVSQFTAAEIVTRLLASRRTAPRFSACGPGEPTNSDTTRTPQRSCQQFVHGQQRRAR